jgi:hypothetical protein
MEEGMRKPCTDFWFVEVDRALLEAGPGNHAASPQFSVFFVELIRIELTASRVRFWRITKISLALTIT